MDEPGPTPDPKVALASAFSAAAPTYDGVIPFFSPFGRALAAAAELRPGERVLDLACGRGASLYPALEAVRPGGSVTGVDLANGMVDRLSSELVAANVTDAEVLQGDAEDLALPDASFDAVLGGFMIFFPTDPGRVLAEAHRVTKPRGRLALSIFDGPPAWPWVADVVREVVGESPIRPADEFNKASVLDPALRTAGFGLPLKEEITERFVFESLDEVEAWQRSHAGRLVLDRLDPVQLERYRGLMAERLEDHRVDGGFELIQRACMVVAYKPSR